MHKACQVSLASLEGGAGWPRACLEGEDVGSEWALPLDPKDTSSHEEGHGKKKGWEEGSGRYRPSAAVTALAMVHMLADWIEDSRSVLGPVLSVSWLWAGHFSPSGLHFLEWETRGLNRSVLICCPGGHIHSKSLILRARESKNHNFWIALGPWHLLSCKGLTGWLEKKCLSCFWKMNRSSFENFFLKWCCCLLSPGAKGDSSY